MGDWKFWFGRLIPYFPYISCIFVVIAQITKNLIWAIDILFYWIVEMACVPYGQLPYMKPYMVYIMKPHMKPYMVYIMKPHMKHYIHVSFHDLNHIWFHVGFHDINHIWFHVGFHDINHIWFISWNPTWSLTCMWVFMILTIYGFMWGFMI